MKLHITHPEVRKVIERCESEVRQLTGNPTIAISFIDTVVSLEFEQIAAEVMNVTKVSMEELQSPSRKIELVQARQLITFFARKFTKITYSEIARKLGNRDHTSILKYMSRTTDLLDSGDKRMSDLVKKINRRLKDLIDELK